jgi:hypothetical protein
MVAAMRDARETRRKEEDQYEGTKVTKLSIPFLVHGEGGMEHPQWRDEYIISSNASNVCL